MPDNPYPAVSGFLTPVYVGKDAAGRTLNAFDDPEVMQRINTGYACGNCCATFHTFQLSCPICKLPTDVSGQAQDAPSLWQEHFDEHNYGSGKTETRTPTEFIDAVMKDKDVDTTTLRKLRRPRWGAGR